MSIQKWAVGDLQQSIAMPDSRRATVGNTECEIRGAQTPPSRLLNLPILLLHMHENCNCRCVMCDIWQRERGREIDLSWLEMQRPSIERLGVRQVVLTGGEPLLHTNFENVCYFLKDCGVRVTLLTTGLLLAKRAETVARAVDEVILSLDGPEEIHDRVRRVRGAFRLMQEGVQEVRRHRPEMPVHARSTIQKMNHRLLRATVAAAHALSLDSISFLAADTTSQAFNRELVWPGERQRQIVLTHTEVLELEAETEALIEENAFEIDMRFIVEAPEKLRSISRRFREQLGEFAPRAPLCNAPWVSAVVEVGGAIRPCFFHQKIGDASVIPLDEAINSTQALQFRATLDVESNPICRHCVCSLNYKGTVNHSLTEEKIEIV
jgi:MoaA/NifB/PqqE/SkfB family radical SAM enzyme